MTENSINRTKYYSQIFEKYLNFTPFFRRDCFELKNMFKILKDLKLNDSIFNEPDFYILMEWFNSLNLIKPFFIVHFPKEHNHHICYNNQEILLNKVGELKTLYEEGIICFPEEIYNNDSSIKNKIDPWDFNKIKHKIKTRARGSQEDEPLEEKIAIEEKLYFYHPIQFIQLLTYLLAYDYQSIRKHLEYKKFYWKRRFNFKDYLIERIKTRILEENETFEQFIEKKTSSGQKFHQFDSIFFIQNRWLIERSLLLWIKLESIYATRFYGLPRIDFHIPNKEKFHIEVDKHNKWSENIEKNLATYFDKEDLEIIRKFRAILEVNLRIDGLENFLDLFLYISPEKKEKLKGRLNYYINLLEIVRTLRLAEILFVHAFPQLEGKNVEPKYWEPKYYFEDDSERSKYFTRLLLEYGLAQEDLFVIFVEGDTEVIILEDWTKLVLYRTGIKISIKKLPSGKRTAFMFKYLVKQFNTNEFFLILDADTSDYIPGKTAELKGDGIKENSFHIFYPDFITANFKEQEIFEAFISFFDELKINIEKKTGKTLNLSKVEEQDLINKMSNKNEEERYEDIIEEFLKSKLNKQDYKLKKPKFARHLLEIMRKNFLDKKRVPYPFEEILGIFVKKIQKIKYPEINF